MISKHNVAHIFTIIISKNILKEELIEFILLQASNFCSSIYIFSDAKRDMICFSQSQKEWSSKPTFQFIHSFIHWALLITYWLLSRQRLLKLFYFLLPVLEMHFLTSSKQFRFTSPYLVPNSQSTSSGLFFIQFFPSQQMAASFF